MFEHELQLTWAHSRRISYRRNLNFGETANFRKSWQSACNHPYFCTQYPYSNLYSSTAPTGQYHLLMAQAEDIPFELLNLIFKDIYLTSKTSRYTEWYDSDSVRISRYKG